MGWSATIMAFFVFVQLKQCDNQQRTGISCKHWLAP